MSPKTEIRGFVAGTICLIMALAAGLSAQSTATPKSATKKPAAQHGLTQHGLTQEDVQKMWSLGKDMLLSNEIRLKGLAFEPEEDWLKNQLPTLTKVPLAQMPLSAAALKAKIVAGPELDTVSAAAPALLDKIKAAAQQRDSTALEPLVHPELFKTKAKVYDLFDVANYRGHSLGHYAQEPNRQVSVQFFQLTTSQVERVHYVYFSMNRGKVVMRDVKSGNEEAQRFLRDEEQLAKSKLQLMFRALNDGDESGVKTLCSDGLYEAIKNWGGDKHPGDRLTRGRTLEQVSVTTSVPLDQKSIRVVARITYPLSPTKTVAFDADFERIGNDLKIVRVRDTQNKVVVVDPNIDNYLNRRFGLPDAPPISADTLAMTEQEVFLSIKQLQERAVRALQDHNAARIKELAQTFIESDPTGGMGYGLRAGANQMLGNFDDAEKDAGRALEHSGTVYFVVERHLAMQGQPFTPAVLAISKKKIEYLPSTGLGASEEIDMSTVEAKLDIGQKSFLKSIVKSDRPFLALSFMGADGKKKTYNFAAYGTQCEPGTGLAPAGPAGGVCGTVGSAASVTPDGKHIQVPLFDPNAKQLPLYVPRTWQRDLTAVLRTIDQARR